MGRKASLAHYTTPTHVNNSHELIQWRSFVVTAFYVFLVASATFIFNPRRFLPFLSVTRSGVASAKPTPLFFQRLHLSGLLMDFRPKTDPGSPPFFVSTGHGNSVVEKMSISELVSVLRSDVDRFEEVLVARDAKLKAEIGPLQEKIEVERLMRLQAEDELKKKEQQCQEGRRAQARCEKLLKEAKKRELGDKNAIKELRNKISELEHQNLRLKEKWVDDSNAVSELRIRVAELEDAKKKSLETIGKLGAENCKVEHFGRKPGAPLQRNKEIPHSLGASERGEPPPLLSFFYNASRPHQPRVLL